jgi:hypothetical protein
MGKAPAVLDRIEAAIRERMLPLGAAPAIFQTMTTVVRFRIEQAKAD